jgi:hypothetical protein
MNVLGLKICVASGLVALSTSGVLTSQDWYAADKATVRLKPAAFPDLPVTVRQYLEGRGCEIPQAFSDLRTYFGPVNRAFAALDEVGQASLRRDLEQVWSAHNRANDNSTRHRGGVSRSHRHEGLVFASLAPQIAAQQRHARHAPSAGLSCMLRRGAGDAWR